MTIFLSSVWPTTFPLESLIPLTIMLHLIYPYSCKHAIGAPNLLIWSLKWSNSTSISFDIIVKVFWLDNIRGGHQGSGKIRMDFAKYRAEFLEEEISILST